jgi:hypothetical protein
MSDFGFEFNAEEVPASERGEFELIPAGTRAMFQITEAEIVPTKSGSGLKYTAAILDGPFENRKVWGFINVQNANVQCENIGQRELADLCLAIGKAKVSATEDLLFEPFEATLGVQKDKSGQYEPKNVIKKYHAKGGAAPSTAPQSRAGTSVPASKAPPAKTEKPWRTTKAA